MPPLSHVSVAAAAVAYFAIGAIWYTVFAQPWVTGIGKSMEQLAREHAGSPMPYVIGFLAILGLAYTLAWLMRGAGVATLAGGARLGAIVGLGIAAMQLALNYAFEARSVTLWLINGGYAVVGLAVAGAIIGSWHRRGVAVHDERAT